MSMKRCTAPLLSAVLLVAACDLVPTEPPIFETRFVVPGESTTLSVGQLLPPSISVSGSNFVLTLGTQTIPARTLGQMCPPCQAFQGQTVPKPAFVDSVTTTIAMPADVSSANIASGSVTVVLTHNFGFDPLRPPGAATTGSLTITVRNGTRVLGSTTVTDPFPNNTTLTRTVAIAPGTVTGPLQVTIALNSPAGGVAPANWVTVNTNAALSGAVQPNEILIANANVVVRDRPVSVQSVAIDLTGFEDVSDRVSGGALVVTMTNPFGVAGTMTLTLSGGSAGPITKQVTVGAGTTTQRIEFTESELQSLLGNNITLTIQGPVSGTAAGNVVTVTPNQQVSIATVLDLIFEIGAGDDES
jgi:hypothetical protein